MLINILVKKIWFCVMQLDLDIEPSRVAVDPYNWSCFLGLSVLAYAVDACVMELLLISVTIMCNKG